MGRRIIYQSQFTTILHFVRFGLGCTNSTALLATPEVPTTKADGAARLRSWKDTIGAGASR